MKGASFCFTAKEKTYAGIISFKLILLLFNLLGGVRMKIKSWMLMLIAMDHK